MRTIHFETDRDRLEEFKRLIGKGLVLDKGSSDSYPLVFFDSFDWSLYRKGYFAYKTRNSFTITEALTLTPVIVDDNTEVPGFWWEFKDVKTREFLKNITGVRALLPLASIGLSEENYSVRNSDGKIVCRFSLFSPAENKSEDGEHAYVLVKPLKGYSEESDYIGALAKKADMRQLAGPFFKDILVAGGVTPGGYSSKLDIELRKSMNITEAVLVICRHLLDTATANISGIIEDIDTEFVHDFRVATRRTRACLSELKEALPPVETTGLNLNLKSVARKCNELRDLDVYILEKQKYYDMLPPDLHPGLNRYFAYIKRTRNSRQKQFSRYLQSGEFSSILQGWKKIMSDPGIPLNPAPALEAAKSHIYKRYRRIIKRGRQITDDSPDEKLHALRIDCKKLRYLLEFFSSYFPKKKMVFLVGHLKDFQDNLGEFNDLAMQQKNLETYLENSHGKTEDEIKAAAIGGLLTSLHRRQAEVREDFYKRFSGFDSKEVHSLFEELFRLDKA